MKPIELEVAWLPGIFAITLVPFILYRKGHKTECIQRHEHYHWHQALRWGIIPWYLAYFALALINVGRPANQHPLEAAAYKIQWDCEAESKKKG